ncbi:hypothetical protein, partial [Rhodoplanes roseus]|uniref:hypothetical protein n=1 Tax=Rhodoplanes roseus TaxID=29409 RepID=UPI001AEC7723
GVKPHAPAALSPHPDALRASTLPLQARVTQSVAVAPASQVDAAEPDDSFAARHRKKFAESRVESSDPDYLARHRKKFKTTDADDMGEC